jgi:hypothetical protein
VLSAMNPGSVVEIPAIVLLPSVVDNSDEVEFVPRGRVVGLGV